MYPGVARLVTGQQTGTCAQRHEIAGNLYLAVTDNRIAAGQRLQVDTEHIVTDGDGKTLVHLPFFIHTFSGTRLAHEVDETLLENTGADPPQHIVAGDPLDDDVVDAVFRQQLAEQQARRSCADDCYLSLDRLHQSNRRNSQPESYTPAARYPRSGCGLSCRNKSISWLSGRWSWHTDRHRPRWRPRRHNE